MHCVLHSRFHENSYDIRKTSNRTQLIQNSNLLHTSKLIVKSVKSIRLNVSSKNLPGGVISSAIVIGGLAPPISAGPTWRRLHNREYRLNNSRSIRRVPFLRREWKKRSVLWALLAIIITTTPFSPPPPPRRSSSPPRSFNFLIFFVLLPLFRGNRDCALWLFDLFRSSAFPGGRYDYKRYARTYPVYPGYRDRRKRRQKSLPFPLSRPPFIPAFLLDNERPGYRKERIAYGCQKRLPRLISPAILPRIAISETTVNFGDFILSRWFQIETVELYSERIFNW